MTDQGWGSADRPSEQPPEQPWTEQPWTGQPAPQEWQQSPQSWQQPPPQQWQPPYAGTQEARYAPGPGLAVGIVGLICLLLSLFVLDWAKGDKSGFLDLSKNLRNTPDGLDLSFAQSVTVAYGSWAAFVLFGLAVVLVVLAGVPLPASAAGNTYARILGALVVGLGAMAQIVTMTQVFKGEPTPQFGAWLGLAGWFVVAIGFVFGARRVAARR